MIRFELKGTLLKCLQTKYKRNYEADVIVDTVFIQTHKINDSMSHVQMGFFLHT